MWSEFCAGPSWSTKPEVVGTLRLSRLVYYQLKIPNDILEQGTTRNLWISEWKPTIYKWLMDEWCWRWDDQVVLGLNRVCFIIVSASSSPATARLHPWKILWTCCWGSWSIWQNTKIYLLLHIVLRIWTMIDPSLNISDINDVGSLLEETISTKTFLLNFSVVTASQIVSDKTERSDLLKRRNDDYPIEYSKLTMSSV